VRLAGTIRDYGLEDSGWPEGEEEDSNAEKNATNGLSERVPPETPP